LGIKTADSYGLAQRILQMVERNLVIHTTLFLFNPNGKIHKAML
jgi:hypothetical protein